MRLQKYPIALIFFAMLLVCGCTKRARTDHNEVLHNGGKIIKPYYEIRKSKALTLAYGLGLPAAAYFVGAAGGTNPVGGYIAAGLTGTVSLAGVPGALKHNIINKPVTKISELDAWIKDYNRGNSTEYVIMPAKNFNGYCYLVPLQNKNQFLQDEEVRLAKIRQEMREKNQRTVMGIFSVIGAILELGSQGSSGAGQDNNGQKVCPRCGGDGLGSGYDEMRMRNKCGRCGGSGKVF